MAEIYRVEKGSEEWKYKAYDYVRTDAFCCGQTAKLLHMVIFECQL